MDERDLISGSAAASTHMAENRVLMPFGKQNERHTYEKCQYDEFKKRVAKMNELREAKGGARSN